MKRYFFDWLFYVAMWVVVTLFFSIIYITLVNGTIDFFEIKSELFEEPVYEYMLSHYQYVEAVLFGILFGTATFGINLIVDYTSIHRLTFGKTIIIKTILYFVSVTVIFFLMAGIIITSGMSPIEGDEYWTFLNEHMSANFAVGIVSYFVMSTLLINFIVLMARKFGPGHMFQIIIGRYHKPMTENRIFMFLDLKDSTTIAEKLGHIIYSKLLQQCFLDLNKLIPSSRAEIYQYVGDEAVLTWKIRNYESNFIRPIQLFFAFKKKLGKREKYYKSKFGVLPEFKAGINAGVVTVAEIGDLKREIAYHGDVINTASRLRSACNEFEKKMLASEYVVRNINGNYSYEIKEIGEVNLKGKKNKIKVFSID